MVPAGTKPMVSVIIPAYNAQDFIAETLDSILAQSYRNLEIIIVDDGSTDQTSQVVTRYEPNIHYYFQDNSGGCAVPRNTGIRHSTGDLLCFMDADDLMSPERIVRQVDFLDRHPDVGLVFCDYRNFNEEGLFPTTHFETCPLLRSQLGNQEELILENSCSLLLRENFGCAGTLMIRKDVLEIESGFEPTLKACEDFHYYYRLARHSNVGVINYVGMMRRLHGNNMSNVETRMLTERIRSRTLLRDSEHNRKARKQLNDYISVCHTSFARYKADKGKYIDSLKYDWKALTLYFSFPQVKYIVKNIARTISIAMGIYNGSKNRG
jgi:glycosyltransferase involved in cell wall biosynthesis